MTVKNLENVKGVIIDNIQDDSVNPRAIDVIAIIKLILSFLGSNPTSFNVLYTLENPIANTGR